MSESRHEWELIIEIEEAQPDIAWIHSTWDRWSEQIQGLDGFRALSDREEYLVGTLPSRAVRLQEQLNGDWETAMFSAEKEAAPEERLDDSPEVLAEERTTILRVGGESPFWVEIETESLSWLEKLACHPWAVCLSRTPEGVWPRQRWLVPQALLEIS
jgi:hypothetical protein